ncbi:hypothetical protein HZH66_007014 [Vespula vulgaris]|uniref:Uncharacterized protein n=1 Tax=Vespula vulgaris TaxID=7454 RepID=A0A834N4P1_VESVU|nr:hypothetical protein HZH66_007014 [Vespula vulgaris]
MALAWLFALSKAHASMHERIELLASRVAGNVAADADADADADAAVTIALGWVDLGWVGLSYNTYRNLFEMIKNRAAFNLCLLEIPKSGEYLNDLITSNLTNNETCRHILEKAFLI